MVRKILSFVFLACFLCLALLGCANKEVKTKVRIGFQVIPNSEALAKAMHWHEQTMKNVEIEWVPFQSGRDVNTALAAGGIDIGLLGSTLAANGISKGIPYKVIWIADVVGSNEALIVKKNSGIQSITDLKGKTIAVTFGSTTQYALLGALKLNNIHEKDVKIVDMQPPEMLAAWKRGDIDGGYVWQPTLQEMANDGGKVITDSGQLAEKGVITSDIIVARDSFASSNPELVTSYIVSQIRAVEEFRQNQAQSAASIANEFSISNEAALGMMKELIWLSGKEQLEAKYLGTKEKPGNFATVLEDTAKFLHEQKVIDKVPASDAFKQSIMTQFIEQAVIQVEQEK